MFKSEYARLAGIVFFMGIALISCAKAQQLPVEMLTIERAVGAVPAFLSFTVEVAQTPTEQEMGLMFRTLVPQGTGMLFVYNPPQPVTFWMKNTLVPLDMIFINPDGEIMKIHRQAQPQDLTPVPSGGRALAVLELAGGEAERLGLSLGQKIFSPILKKN